MASPTVVTEEITFDDLALAKPIMQAVLDVGYEQPTPIQAASIPPLLAGEDLLGVAQTGTGKTAAFALPLLSRLDLTVNAPQILVLAPTRELAIQVAEAFKSYAHHMKNFRVLPIYGGQEMSGQLRQLKRGVHVVVGTPGRVMDHLRRGTLQLDQLKSLVLDEADEMLRMGFIDDVEWILQHIPAEHQTALFSATMPGPIKKVASKYLNKPREIRIASATQTAEHTHQSYLVVNGFERKLDAITRILEAHDFDAMIIFVRTKTSTVELAEKLEARGYSAAPLNGDMSQVLRERTISRLKKQQLDIVVATDVAARGIDVKRISHVLNFDIPHDSEAYIHRIGRTGRAGREGRAILFVAPRERRLLETIARATRQPIAMMKLPSGKEVSGKRIDQFKQHLTETLAQQDLKFYADLLLEYNSEAEQPIENIAAALAYLLQRERPLQVKDAPPSSDRQSKHTNRDNRENREKDNRHKPRVSRKGRDSSTRGSNTRDGNMQEYRIDVGRNDAIGPGDIVGAIANEANIDSCHIGHIRLHDNYSTVALSAQISADSLQKLRALRIRNRPVLLRPNDKKTKKL